MLDINLFRVEKGNNPEIIRESLRRRFANVEIVDEIIHLDKECRQRQFEVDQLRKDFNKINKEVVKLRIAGEDASSMIKNTEENKESTAKKEAEVQEARAALYAKLEMVGNLVHDFVPVMQNWKWLGKTAISSKAFHQRDGYAEFQILRWCTVSWALPQVGPHGSGKSNVIDAMLFVFGKRAKQICDSLTSGPSHAIVIKREPYVREPMQLWQLGVMALFMRLLMDFFGVENQLLNMIQRFHVQHLLGASTIPQGRRTTASRRPQPYTIES